ncbi:MAG: hypothetical protein JXR77_09255 [Lentisphaeria bacterium]|nr:hypothetical protein [Lentisphaeria bacterium]
MRQASLFLAVLPACAAAVAQEWRDDFDGKTLDTRWEWRVPVAGPTLSLTERPGWLRIRLPERQNGFNHWHEPTAVDEAPQLRTRVPEGDWEFEARVVLHQVAVANHVHVGLVVGVNDAFLLGFGPFQGPTLPGGPKTPEICLEATGASGFHRVAGEARDVRLQLRRSGNLCRARFSRDGKDWLDAGAYILPETPRFLGILGKTFSAGPPVAFDVDWVRLTPAAGPEPSDRRALVGIGGEYPTGYRGMLSRLGLPHEVLLDYQLANVDILRRFDLLLIGSVSDGIALRARESLVRYVREGGTALVDGCAFPPPEVLRGTGKPTRDIPDILVGGAANPLLPRLGPSTRFAAGESRFHYEPASFAGLQILARYDGQPGSKAKPGKDAPYTGTPAIWAMPLGSGLLVYSSPSLGATLSWGPAHDALAEALVQLLGWGRLAPQWLPEGERFGRKQSGLTEGNETPLPVTPPPLPPFARVTPGEPASDPPPDRVTVRGRTAPEFNLSGTYLADRGQADLWLNHWNDRYRVSVAFDPASVRLTRIEAGKAVETTELALDKAQRIPFLLKERRDRIVLLLGSKRAEIGAEGLWEGQLAAAAGDAFDRLRYQPVEPPFLSDDFMRGEKEKGAWETLSGEWSVRAQGDPRMGANPFAYRGKASRGAALAVTGLPFWDDYLFETSLRPVSAGGAAGLAFRCRDAGNGILVRLRLAEAPDRGRNGAEIVRLREGRETVLARAEACLVRGQWYRLAVRLEDTTATVLIDGMPLAVATDIDCPDGKPGLYVRDGEADFDDVAVRPLDSRMPSTELTELDGSMPRFAGTLDRDTWAGTALQWQADAATPGLFWRHGAFRGDVDLAFACPFGEGDVQRARIDLLLTAADAGAADGGYALSLRPAPPKPWQKGAFRGGKCSLELLRRGVPVARGDVTTGPGPVLALRRSGSRLLGLVDGREVLAWDMDEPAADLPRLGFLATGCRPRISGLRLRAGNVLDTCFDRAPADWWVASGTWDLAVRWPCTPEWSWLAGESRETAALWHKRTFHGNITVDLHVGPRTIDHGDGRPREICRAFNLVLCGDGRDITSGYSFVVGADAKGAGAILSRKGQIVAREDAYRVYSDAHNQWLNVRAEKRGAEVRLWVADQCVLAWTDPDPLPEGRIAIWTRDNAIMVPRVTIFYANDAAAPGGRPG